MTQWRHQAVVNVVALVLVVAGLEAHLCVRTLVGVGEEHVVETLVPNTFEKPLDVHPRQPIKCIEAQGRVLDENLLGPESKRGLSCRAGR